MDTECNINPLFDRVVVKRVERTSSSGVLFIPDAAKKKVSEGIVTAAGPGRVSSMGKFIGLAVSVGDHVKYDRHAGTEIISGGVSHFLLKENDVHLIIEEGS